ncbi:MAG: hypothetical protein KDE27_19110, partial [Planctomycetes bacterium]|nr:hypothetical protein [Planctomycetota bacterium]
SVPTACVGPAGPMLLTAAYLPWIGSSFESMATGFAPSSLAVSAYGLATQSLPLALLHAAGLPNCDLLVTAEAVRLLVPAGGSATLQFAIPKDLSLVGVRLHHQFLQGEFGAQGALLSLSASNALALTVGAF